jgi:hypothetical protein
MMRMISFGTIGRQANIEMMTGIAMANFKGLSLWTWGEQDLFGPAQAELEFDGWRFLNYGREFP